MDSFSSASPQQATRTQGPLGGPRSRQLQKRERQRNLSTLLFLSALVLFPLHRLEAQNPPALTSGVSGQSAGTSLTVPANTRIPLALQSAISSKTAYVGQSIYCRTTFPITVNDRIIIPVGSYVEGSITQVVHAHRFHGKAKLGLRFNTITLPSGTTRPLRATLSSFAGNGKEGFNRKEGKINGGSSKGRDAGRIARATIHGAVIGTLVGMGRGRTLRGLGIGSAAGATGGVIWVMATRGRKIYLRRGTSLELELTEPLRIDRRS